MESAYDDKYSLLDEHKIPVFLCGFPRSGTTLLLALLDRHPELLVFPEETTFLALMGQLEYQTLDYYLTHTGASAFQYGEVTFPSGYRDYSDIDFAVYRQTVEKYWKASDKSEQALMESLIFAYGRVTGQLNKGYWVEKTPSNEDYLKQAQALWPRLRAIYVIRDPRDNYSSYRNKRAKDSLELPVLTFVTRWYRSLLAWRRFARQNPENSLLLIYRDLVQNPEAEMRRICDFLQIDWHENLLEPTRNGVFWSGNSTHGVVHEGISTSSIGKFRDHLTPDEITFIERWFAFVMKHYGWPLMRGDLSWLQNIHYMLPRKPEDLKNIILMYLDLMKARSK
jgi:hypothetical protein